MAVSIADKNSTDNISTSKGELFLKKIILYMIASFVVLLDFFTKHLVRTFDPDIALLPFFSITYITNTGTAFGLFKGNNLLFIFLTILILGVLIYYSSRMPNTLLFNIGFGLVIGGAIGNLIDRILFQSVTDFINFHFWPAFNVADASITVSIVILIIALIRVDQKTIKNNE